MLCCRFRRQLPASHTNWCSGRPETGENGPKPVGGSRFQAVSRRVENDREGGVRPHKMTGGQSPRQPSFARRSANSPPADRRQKCRDLRTRRPTGLDATSLSWTHAAVKPALTRGLSRRREGARALAGFIPDCVVLCSLWGAQSWFMRRSGIRGRGRRGGPVASVCPARAPNSGDWHSALLQKGSIDPAKSASQAGSRVDPLRVREGVDLPGTQTRSSGPLGEPEEAPLESPLSSSAS